MWFEWDEDKAADNEVKHGVTFEEAATCFYDPLQVAGVLRPGPQRGGGSGELAKRSGSSRHGGRRARRLGTMRKEYEISKLKVKRRGPLPAFRDAAGRPMKVRITITLDQDLVEHFKAEAAKPGALPYQTQINQALRKALAGDELRPEQTEAIKAALLKDPDFLREVAHRLEEAR